MSGSDLALLIAAAVLTAAWLVIVGAVRAYRQPREPEELEPTLELGAEPPALAGFLAGNFKVRREAVPATLLDLCARGIVEIERVDVDRYQCQLKDGPIDGLAPYETRVLELLRRRARNGVVPTRALTTGPGDESKRWWRNFVREVVNEAQTRGLSRDLWPRRLAILVALIAAAAAALLGLAFGANAFYAYAIVPVGVIVRIRSGRRQRDTPAGLEAAGRWRAVQAKLAENPVFADQAPIAVALWERLLAYGAALGVAPGAIRPVPMGADPETRAWSTYGGRWHQVDVSYRQGFQWGLHPGVALLSRTGVAALGAFVLWVVTAGFGDQLDDAEGGEQLVLLGLVGIPALFALGGAVLALRAALDLFTSKEVTGEIVRLRTRGAKNDVTRHLAVDDGSSTDVRAWVVRPAIYGGLTEGDVVTVEVTPRLGYVRSIRPAPA